MKMIFKVQYRYEYGTECHAGSSFTESNSSPCRLFINARVDFTIELKVMLAADSPKKLTHPCAWCLTANANLRIVMNFLIAADLQKNHTRIKMMSEEECKFDCINEYYPGIRFSKDYPAYIVYIKANIK